jgi:hypothetical protein
VATRSHDEFWDDVSDRFEVEVCYGCGQPLNGDGHHAHGDGHLSPRATIEVLPAHVGDRELREAVARFCGRLDAPEYLREALETVVRKEADCR